jgi:hypothetical protein
MPTALDLAPLTQPLPPSAVQAYRDAARRAGAPWAQADVSQIIGIAFGALGGGIAIIVFGGLAASTTFTSIRNGSPVGAVFGLFWIAVPIVVAVVIVRRMLHSGSRWGRWARIAAFAQANGLDFAPQARVPGYPGLIFGLGSDRIIREHVSTRGGRFVDMGGYEYTTGSGKNRSTHRWSFLAVRLDRKLPNIVLDSRQNNGVLGSNLPVALARDQVLHLEGDFDRFFTLYCPKDYETDALYVFTPDLMALLIDEAAPFDVEIVDDWFFAYSSRTLDMADPTTYERLFRIVDTVGTKAARQTERYRDDRVADAVAANVVAPQGARLKHGVSIGAVVGVVVVVAWIGWSFVSRVAGF